eukprot:3545712-Rhodomonas_salina.1
MRAWPSHPAMPPRFKRVRPESFGSTSSQTRLASSPRILFCERSSTVRAVHLPSAAKSGPLSSGVDPIAQLLSESSVSAEQCPTTSASGRSTPGFSPKSSEMSFALSKIESARDRSCGHCLTRLARIETSAGSMLWSHRLSRVSAVRPSSLEWNAADCENASGSTPEKSKSVIAVHAATRSASMRMSAGSSSELACRSKCVRRVCSSRKLANAFAARASMPVCPSSTERSFAQAGSAWNTVCMPSSFK